MKTPPPETARPSLLFVARVETCERVAALFDDASIEEADDQCTTWFDADRDVAIIEYFCSTRAEAEHRLAALQAFLDTHARGERWTTTIRDMPVENWAEAWKKFFHTEKVSDRIWIKPSWESCPAAPGEIVLEIDPGMSFGTGQHGTTRGCLQVMDALATGTPAPTLADIGCGSGILAIAAAKLGYRDILAMDNDPEAVRIARENALHNATEDRITFHTGALGQSPLFGTFDVVVANILATVLIEQAGALTRAVSSRPSARLVLSGILNAQAEEVLAAFQPLAFRPVNRLQLGEWTTLCLRRDGSP
jgi:ribosomal protein L11 methyltransferase